MNKFIVLFLVGIVCFAGCSKVPTVAIQNAEVAIVNLEAAGAAEYAPEELNATKNSMSRMKAEVAVQDKKFVLFRKYKNSEAMALLVKQTADSVSVITETNKATTKAAAELAITKARIACNDAKSLIEVAPVGKGSELDLKMLQADVAGVEQMVNDASLTYDSGKYKGAIIKAEASLNAANAIVSDVNAAISMGKKR
jgi:hypothetical protein